MHKKIAVSIMLLYLVFSSMTTAVYAQPQLPSAGLTPDHPLYFLDRMFEGLELWFAEVVGGREGRARKMLEIAGERLSEMKAMAEQGKTQHIPSLVEDYRAKMNEATEIATKLNLRFKTLRKCPGRDMMKLKMPLEKCHKERGRR